jgi:hypothetical protein
VQENRLDKYHNDTVYTTLAVLDFSLSPEQVSCVLSSALELVATRARYSMRELFGTLIALRHPSLRGKTNLLSRPQSYYCSAFVHHLFRCAGMDLAPGLDEKNTTPEDLWRTLSPHTAYILRREPKRDGAKRILTRLSSLRQRAVPKKA